MGPSPQHLIFIYAVVNSDGICIVDKFIFFLVRYIFLINSIDTQSSYIWFDARHVSTI